MKKKYGRFSKRSTPNEKNMFIIGKQYANAKFFSPVMDYRKYFMFEGGEGRRKERRRGEKKKREEKKTDVSLKIFQAWITETVFNLFKTVL